MELICLANSMRPDGRCIAGIDPDTGLWIRPVPRDADAIPEVRCFLGGRFLSLLDVLELELIRPRESPKYQCENYIVKNWKWAIRGRARRASIEQFIDDSFPVLHSRNDRVSPSVLEKLSPPEWKSLQFVRPRNLRFEPDPWTPHRWRARFKDAGRNEYFLKVTDPDATRRLELGERISPSSLLTISLTKPWSPGDSKPKMCFKLVAAVVEASS